VNTIQSMVQAQKLRTREVALSVSGHSVIIKKISLPAMTAEELAESIKWEAEQYIPFDINDVYLDYEVLKERPEQGQMDVLLVAAKREVVDEYIGVVRDAGLEPVVVDVDCLTIQNAFEISYGFSLGETVVLIDVGASTLNINVLSGKSTTFTRDISMGGNQYTEEIQKQLGVSYDEAEAYKLGGERGVDADSVVPHEVERVMTQVSESIASEIHRSLDFYLATSSEGRLSKIYLSGGSAKVPSLSRTIEQRVGVQLPQPKKGVNPVGCLVFRLRKLALWLARSGGFALRATRHWRDASFALQPLARRGETVQESLVARIPVRMVLTGTFQQISSFYYNLGQLKRIVNVGDIELATQRKPSEPEEERLTANCVATTFQYLGERAAPPPAPGAP
jgi:type IV pilus assembly protein PilM